MPRTSHKFDMRTSDTIYATINLNHTISYGNVYVTSLQKQVVVLMFCIVNKTNKFTSSNKQTALNKLEEQIQKYFFQYSTNHPTRWLGITSLYNIPICK